MSDTAEEDVDNSEAGGTQVLANPLFCFPVPTVLPVPASVIS